ncbi:MAG: aminopeptidase [Chloroflexota bacterium]
MTDIRIQKLANILVTHSTRIQPGDRVLIEATTAAEPLVRALYAAILDHGGHPHLLLTIPDQEVLFFDHAGDDQLDFMPTFQKLAYDTFEARIRIHSDTNPRALTEVDPARHARRQKALAPILRAQMWRGAEKTFKWVTTLFPTEAYAKEAGMDLKDYEDFVYNSCFADEKTADPIAAWKAIEDEQQNYIERIEGHDKVEVRGPNVDITLSVKGRVFKNSFGENNMPDGEIFTGPVEKSVNGWVRYTYPAIIHGRVVEGVELTFKRGKVVKATAEKNQDFLLEMLDIDAGARYVGEFAVGTNFNISRFTHQILFDEKIGGSFHMALGAGYPDTGSLNKSIIHWDMICDLRTDSVILVDGELVYRNGEFVS